MLGGAESFKNGNYERLLSGENVHHCNLEASDVQLHHRTGLSLALTSRMDCCSPWLDSVRTENEERKRFEGNCPAFHTVNRAGPT